MNLLAETAQQVTTWPEAFALVATTAIVFGTVAFICWLLFK